MGITSGIKVALPGYDARTAPDYDLSFSSNWPMLQVVKTINYTVTTADVTTADPAFIGNKASLTLTHNLGFYAFADVWAYSNDTLFGGVVAKRLNSQTDFHIYMGKNSIKMITAISYGSSITDNPIIYLPVGTNIAVKLYQFDFSKSFEYSAITPPTFASQYDPKVGIKIARKNRNIHSKDLRDFIFHSKGSAPQILTVLTNDSKSIQYGPNNNLAYQIPDGIPARLDYLYSTDNDAWNAAFNRTGMNVGVYEASTGLAYYSTVYGQYDVQSVGNVSYFLTNTGMFTSYSLGAIKKGSGIPFSLIVRRDPLLYSASKVINI